MSIEDRKLDNKRDQELDIIKGIGIILMVLGHSGFPFTHFIYLFHMALFFMVSGYLWDYKKCLSIKTYIQFVKRKMKTLYLPYVIANYIFTLLNNSFLKMGIYTNNPELFKWVPANYGYELNTMLSYKDTLSHLVKVTCFFGDTQMGGAMWFLRTLFLVSILYGAFSVVVNVNNKTK